MKNFSMRGFTLIELLVVIAIIGILMSMLFPAVNGAMEAAKKAQAKNDVTQIAAAVKAYEVEYGKMPDWVGPGSDGYAWTQLDNNNLFDALRGVGLDTNNNPRNIAFIEMKPAKGTPPKGGLGSNGIFYDPWGTPYGIKMDSKYDHNLNWYDDRVGTSAIAISFGKNKTCEDPNQKNDDIVSYK